MRKKSLYIETSVWNFLIADDVPDKRHLTEQMFGALSRDDYELFISKVVLEEIDKAPVTVKNKLMELIVLHSPIVLEPDEDSEFIAEAYISNGLLGPRHIYDLTHIAIATVNRIEVLVSWNMKHMVNLKAKGIVSGTNRLHGYFDLSICTPEEVLGYEE